MPITMTRTRRAGRMAAATLIALAMSGGLVGCAQEIEPIARPAAQDASATDVQTRRGDDSDASSSSADESSPTTTSGDSTSSTSSTSSASSTSSTSETGVTSETDADAGPRAGIVRRPWTADESLPKVAPVESATIDATGAAGLVVAYGAPSRPCESASGRLVALDPSGTCLYAWGAARLDGATLTERATELAERASIVLNDVVSDRGPIISKTTPSSGTEASNGWQVTWAMFDVTMPPLANENANDLVVSCRVVAAETESSHAWALVAERADGGVWTNETTSASGSADASASYSSGGVSGSRYLGYTSGTGDATVRTRVAADLEERAEALVHSLRIWDLATQRPWDGRS